MSKTIHFNTGRAYTANGQRITATLHDDGVVTFWDHDRMVHGEYHMGLYDEDWLTKVDVMGIYDAGKHTNSTRSWQDGMLRGGCNAKWEG
ncbi:hypothetical protein [Mesorhizobium sp.]|uniref:hypothetical protein n=1 Tax=Mesorhizobium sp. TaxID=1871066 RepID=UPI000FE41C35|nr:hypothetical protein [Mesorhizobium sp.]RWJ03484.1 MAG: hypothetical protein EOR24_32405 [Mesorhizobium sp.]